MLDQNHGVRCGGYVTTRNDRFPASADHPCAVFEVAVNGDRAYRQYVTIWKKT
jgi:hypothetical protein